MYTIVGLGNPGEKYELTRHNAGRIILREALGGEVLELRLGDVVQIPLSNHSVRVAFPDTYMNESGNFVRRLMENEEIDRLIVVCDDVDLPLGEFKISFGRGDGGHNGVSSIINSLGTKDFIRIRIGISKKNFWGHMVRAKGEELAEFVLGHFLPKEIKALGHLATSLREALELIVKNGVNVAMNKFN